MAYMKTALGFKTYIVYSAKYLLLHISNSKEISDKNKIQGANIGIDF